MLAVCAVASALLALGACRGQPPATGAPAPTAVLTLAFPGVATPVPPTFIGIVPTVTLIPTLVVIPTVTPFTPPPGATAAGTAVAGASRKGTISVLGVRIEPQTPHNKEPVAFFATFNNTAGRDTGMRWCAEVYRPGEDRSFGATRCEADVIPPGVSEHRTFGWNIAGIRDCIPLRARMVSLGGGNARVPIRQPNGQDLWFGFQACP